MGSQTLTMKLTFAIIFCVFNGFKIEKTNVAVSNSTLEKANQTSLPNDDPNPDKKVLIKITTEKIPTTKEKANQTSLANDDSNQDIKDPIKITTQKSPTTQD